MYGTLRQSNLQLEWFGRELPVVADRLTGYRLEMVELGSHPIVEQSGEKYHPILQPDDQGHGVTGVVAELSHEEFEKVANASVKEYKQIEERLESGIKAFVSVLNPATAVQFI